jgi:endonuclease III
MKNATKHAEELKSVLKKLIKQHTPQDRAQHEPLNALVRAAMSYDVPDKKADEAMNAIEKEFVDLIELRVATELEVQELLGQRYPQIEQRVTMITQALNNIFEREHTLSLNRLRDISRRDARNFLRELPDIHPFVEAYVMLFAFDGHSFPIDETMLEYLRDQGIVDEDTSLEDAQRFVEHHLKDDECHSLFSALRRFVYDRPSKPQGTKKKAKA